VIGGAAASAINPGERAQVEPFDGFENEAGQVIFWQPVIQRWGAGSQSCGRSGESGSCGDHRLGGAEIILEYSD
jgi:hypothetical protein